MVLGMTSTFAWSTRAAPAAAPSPSAHPSSSSSVVPPSPSAPSPLATVLEPARTLAPNGEVLPGLKEWKGRRNPLLWDRYYGAKAFVLYREHCAPCHGPAGRGDGPQVSSLPPGQPRPADFSTGRFAYGREDWQVMRTIWLGVPGTSMTGWRAPDRDPRDAWILVHYVKRRCTVDVPRPSWEDEPPPPGTR